MYPRAVPPLVEDPDEVHGISVDHRTRTPSGRHRGAGGPGIEIAFFGAGAYIPASEEVSRTGVRSSLSDDVEPKVRDVGRVDHPRPFQFDRFGVEVLE